MSTTEPSSEVPMACMRNPTRSWASSRRRISARYSEALGCGPPRPMTEKSAVATARRSSPAELRSPALEKGAHALQAVLGRERELEQPSLLVEAGRERGLLGGQDRLLGQPRGERRALGHGTGEVERLLEPAALRGHAVDEPHPLGLGRVDPSSGEDELHGALLADRARQPLRPAASGYQAEHDLRLAELRALGGPPE